MNNPKQRREAALAKASQIAQAARDEARLISSDEMQRFDAYLAEAEAAGYAAQADAARATLESRFTPSVKATSAGAWLANEIRALVPGSGSGTAIDYPAYANYALDTLTLESTFLRSGVNQIVLADGEGYALNLPTVTSDVTTYNIGAGTAITASDPTIATTTATPQKFAALTTISNEVLYDANPAVLDSVGRSIVKSISNAFDLAAFTGSGTAPAIAGLQTSAGGTVSMGTNGASLSSLDPFVDAMATVMSAGAEPTAIVVGVRTWKAMLKLRTLSSGSNTPLLLAGGAQYGAGAAPAASIYGVPVYVSGSLPVNETAGTATTAAQSAYVYSARDVHAVFRRTRAATSSLVSIERDSSALFGTDASQIRGILRASVAVPYAGAVCRITGILA